MSEKELTQARKNFEKWQKEAEELKAKYEKAAEQLKQSRIALKNAEQKALVEKKDEKLNEIAKLIRDMNPTVEQLQNLVEIVQLCGVALLNTPASDLESALQLIQPASAPVEQAPAATEKVDTNVNFASAYTTGGTQA